MSDHPLARVDHLVELAETLAAAWGARASICTTVGQERANLRLLGVTGVDRTGRPLAGAAVDRFVAGQVDRLAAGIILPFVAALAEYDLSPQALALDVASGAVDLSLESEILHDSARRADVEAMAADLAASAFERIDANRTARLELLAVIGDAARPWIGVTTAEPESADGAREAGLLVAAGVDVVRAEDPGGRLQGPPPAGQDHVDAAAPGGGSRLGGEVVIGHRTTVTGSAAQQAAAWPAASLIELDRARIRRGSSAGRLLPSPRLSRVRPGGARKRFRGTPSGMRP